MAHTLLANSLPQEKVSWFCVVRRLHTWMETKKGSDVWFRPWMVLVLHQNTGMPLTAFLAEVTPTAKWLHKKLTAAMRKPKSPGLAPHRPLTIYFADRALLEAIRPLLVQMDIGASYKPRNKLMDQLLDELQAKFMDDTRAIPGLLKQPGVTPELVGKLFEAAALFYHAQPWVNMTNLDLVAVQVGAQQAPYYVCVMGNAGQQYGLGLFTAWQEVEQFFTGRTLEESFSAQGRHVFYFDPPPMVSLDDAEAIETYGWELPAPNIYPSPFIASPTIMARPNANMLRWYEVTLRALPEFAARYLQTNPDGSHPPVSADIMVQSAAGPVKVSIRYPAGDPAQLKNWLDSQGPDSDAANASIPDRRALEGDMAHLTAGMFGEPLVNDPRVTEAQEIMYDAWDESSPSRRLKLAQKALQISSDCADAYVLMAEQASSRQRSLDLYQQGVAAGRRALGEAFMADAANVGHFWSLIETRPFMRALAGVADTLWGLGRREETLATFRELLRFNSNDNQGIRYLLLSLLLEMGRQDEAEVLLEAYVTDCSPHWTYTRALLAFRKEGASSQAQQVLEHALEVNPHVVAYLTGQKRISDPNTAYITVGGEDEAMQYASDYLSFWRKTKGAVAWLESFASKS